MQLTENFSLRLTKEESEKLATLARQLKTKRSDVVRRLIVGASLEHRVTPNVISRIAENREEYDV